MSICGQVSPYKLHREGCGSCLAMSKLCAAQQISYYIKFIETDLLEKIEKSNFGDYLGGNIIPITIVVVNSGDSWFIIVFGGTHGVGGRRPW